MTNAPSTYKQRCHENQAYDHRPAAHNIANGDDEEQAGSIASLQHCWNQRSPLIRNAEIFRYDVKNWMCIVEVCDTKGCHLESSISIAIAKVKGMFIIQIQKYKSEAMTFRSSVLDSISTTVVSRGAWRGRLKPFRPWCLLQSLPSLSVPAGRLCLSNRLFSCEESCDLSDLGSSTPSLSSFINDRLREQNTPTKFLDVDGNVDGNELPFFTQSMES